MNKRNQRIIFYKPRQLPKKAVDEIFNILKKHNCKNINLDFFRCNYCEVPINNYHASEYFCTKCSPIAFNKIFQGEDG